MIENVGNRQERDRERKRNVRLQTESYEQTHKFLICLDRELREKVPDQPLRILTAFL